MENNVKQRFLELLRSTQRKGIEELITYLETSGFFIMPASSKYHNNFEGGLMAHSLGVYDKLSEFNSQFQIGVDENSIIIAALLHDLCKINAYQRTKDGKGWTWNRSRTEDGHAVLSLVRVKQFIELTEVEEKMIQYHMGVYGLKEFDEKGEYTLRNESMANAWYHHPIVKLTYFADELATFAEGKKS
jgi:putative nucleotidyltransferase with HDIG domain